MHQFLVISFFVFIATFYLTFANFQYLLFKPISSRMTESSLAVMPKPEWGEPEKWIWEKVCNGEVADFNDKFQHKLDPGNAEGWDIHRRVSSAFIETVLLKDPYRSALPRRGLRIEGALIDEKIDLSNARISTEWWIDKSRFEQLVKLYSVNASNHISFARSFFNADLDMNYLTTTQLININGLRISGTLIISNMSIEKALLFGDGAEAEHVNLNSTRIAGAVNLKGLTVKRTLGMNGLGVGAELIATGINVKGDIILVGANVKGQVRLEEANVDGVINMNGLFTDSDLLMSNGVRSSTIKLTGARIGGQLDLSGAKIINAVEMSGFVVGEDLLMGEESEFGEVDLTGAKINGDADISTTKITGPLSMIGTVVKNDLFLNEHAHFNSVKLISAQVGGDLNFDDSMIDDKLSMSSIDINGGASMINAMVAGEVNLRSAKIQGSLNMSGAKVNGKLVLDRVIVNSSLYLRDKAEFLDIDMRSARVAVEIEMLDIIVKKRLLMNDLTVSGRMHMGNGASFSSIDMIGAKLGSQFDIIAAKVHELFEMQSIAVSGNVFIRDCHFREKVSLIDSKIGGSIMISSNRISILDLGGTSIQAELQIGEPDKKNNWECHSLINLSNASVRNLSDGGKDSWPESIVIDGFDYSDLGQGARSERTNDDISKRPITWFVDWLKKMKIYYWPPYYHLAQLYNRLGQTAKANKILYESKERERRDAKENGPWGRWVGLTLLNWTIGYGYGTRYFRSLLWALGFLIIGTLVIGTVKEGNMKSADFIDQVGFSLDKLLPIFKLNSEYKLDFHGLPLVYFYIHEIIGFVLGSFVVAGMSGITKR